MKTCLGVLVLVVSMLGIVGMASSTSHVWSVYSLAPIPYEAYLKRKRTYEKNSFFTPAGSFFLAKIQIIKANIHPPLPGMTDGSRMPIQDLVKVVEVLAGTVPQKELIVSYDRMQFPVQQPGETSYYIMGEFSDHAGRAWLVGFNHSHDEQNE